MIKKSILLLQIIALSGCSAAIHDAGSVSDHTFSGKTNKIAILNVMSNDTGLEQGAIISQALSDKLKACQVGVVTFNPNRLSLNINSDIDNFIANNSVDKVLYLSNRNVTVTQNNIILSEIIRAKMFDIESKKNIWMADFDYHASKWHFGDVWKKNDTKSAKEIADKIEIDLKDAHIIKDCS